MQQTMLGTNISEFFQSQFARFMEWSSKLDQKLSFRYGDRYNKVKQQFIRIQDWYEKTKSEAINSGTIPLEQKQAKISHQLAEAGANTARKEGIIKMQLKELWRTLKNI
jgi:hypothetical protein